MKLTKLLFLAFTLTSTALVATTFTNPGVIELGDAPSDPIDSNVVCHDGDIVILHKGDYLSIQATTLLPPNTLPSKSFSFYFDSDAYLIKDPSVWASRDTGIVHNDFNAGILNNTFFSRMWVLAQNVGTTKLYCVSLNQDNIAEYSDKNINTLTDDRVQKITITIDVQP